ncbi:MAG: ExeM/NucH family extracellular endonuclease, partial [Planctomycetota bacterium]
SFDWESVEGMVVTLPYPMYVVDTYDLVRRGRFVLASEQQRVPTDVDQPDRAGFRKAQQVIKSARITVDDGITTQNKFPIPLLPEIGKQWETLRFGSRVTDLTGVVTQYKRDYFLIPTERMQLQPQARPGRPSLGEADLVVASFNVLNFFTTIDNGSNGARGADNASELQRQRDKLVAAIIDLNADVIGLMELENNLQAEQDLVNALNQQLGSDAFAGCGLSSGFSEAPGASNKIRVGMIYRKDRVEQVNELKHVDNPAFFNARTPLVGEFKTVNSDQSFTLIVNHFKSKGASDAEGKDRDQNDGQSAYNASRTRQAKAITNFVEGIVRSGQPNVLVIGDLNAYRYEDPIDVLRDAGLVDLLETKSQDPFPYTFVYFGQAGSLDQSFATPGLAASVTRAEPWHINAAEPRSLDYNTEFNPDSLYRPDPFRSSDHDPVLIGIRFQ